MQLLALIIALARETFVGGSITFRTGYYTPRMLLSCALGCVGTCLISFHVDELKAR
jgi:hypothetical protein